MIKMLNKENDTEFHNLNKAFLNILEDKGITSPKTLSEMTGIDKATISRQMSNKQSLSLNNIAIYSEVLNVPKGKFIEEYTPFYWIVGYVNHTIGGKAIVSGRVEEDPQKVIFPNHYRKLEDRKILYDLSTQHLLIYDVDISQKTKGYEPFLNTYSFVRTNEVHMTGYIGFVTKLTDKKVELTYLNGEKSGPLDYYRVYAIMITYNMKYSENDIAIVDG